ncbi:hypothetical protein [Candidatus Nitrotoga sp. 1052]|uniref:hypothetical protein n=1 Tax=Candidatus Nitrotoga sp. 1052 TaxID=2886964 RepID=UPI001EF745F3|nr:hypothetical protein [Candidatus Nitrotoga sp. 1052]CAH1082872.1 conserved hypothetical protein [Candidatus Nitrotoga sp. 1052]
MKKLVILSAVLLVILTGCDVGLFNSGCRAMGDSGYSLCRNEDGPTAFYLEPNHKAPSGGGILDGTVQSIGWNEKVIVAQRQSTFRGDPDGLFVLDIASKKVDGPIDQEIIAKQYPSIKLMDASNAWSSLR